MRPIEDVKLPEIGRVSQMHNADTRPRLCSRSISNWRTMRLHMAPTERTLESMQRCWFGLNSESSPLGLHPYPEQNGWTLPCPAMHFRAWSRMHSIFGFRILALVTWSIGDSARTRLASRSVALPVESSDRPIGSLLKENRGKISYLESLSIIRWNGALGLGDSPYRPLDRQQV